MLKKIMHFTTLFFLLNTIAFAKPTPLSSQKEQLLDRIVAIANDEVITQTDLNTALNHIKKEFLQRGLPLPNKKELTQQAIESLINEKLQLQLAKRSNINATDKEIDAAISRIMSQYHITSNAIFKEQIEQEGMTYNEFREKLRTQLIISKLEHEAIDKEVVVNQSDIASFQKQHQNELVVAEYHLATILIPLPESSSNQANLESKAKAESILKQLKTGSSTFELMMKTHPGSTDLGWRTLDNVPTLFANAAAKMKPGEIIGPLKAPNGFHIIKLLDKKTRDNISTAKIQQIVYQQKVNEALKKWLAKIRQMSYVQVYSDS